MPELPDSRHFSAEQLAAFLDGRLTTDERGRALAHFAACSACRREMSATRRLLAPKRAYRRFTTVALMTALAAALAVVMVTRTAPEDIDDESTVRSGERAVQPDRLPRVIVVSPAERAVVDSALVFRWRPAGAEATYRVVLQDAAGAVKWETTTGDTTAALPGAIILASGAQYFWSVDAQLADGGSANGGSHRFTAR
jgi:anti-sigma factor RsiW